MKKLIISFLFFIIPLISEAAEFRSAKPVWPEDREKEMNLLVGFRAAIDTKNENNITLRITCSGIYRIYINGELCGAGPARGPHGYFRIDEWDITENIKSGKNLIAVEAAGYNVNSYYLLDQPSFIQAEVISEGNVLASTNGNGAGFDAVILKERVQKVQRYSFQRTFSEVYRLSPGFDAWRKEISTFYNKAACSVFPYKKLLPRRVPYPELHKYPPVWNISRGIIQPKKEKVKLWKDRALTGVGPIFKGYRENELDVIPSIELQKLESVPIDEINRSFKWDEKIKLTDNSYHILDLGTNLTGFVGAKITCKKAARLLITFDEILSNGDVDFKRLGCVNIIDYTLSPGTYEIESFEPYTLRYLKFIALEGSLEIENIYLRDYVNPEADNAYFSASDRRLNKLFDAGRETFRQNALDIFMDCPSRERAGWLCDSYFTARAALDLCGNTVIEKNFLENFLLPQKFAFLPNGMLPMCYPADHNKGRFIPNWALWFILELEEYLQRSGDTIMVEALRGKVLNLLDYFKNFENPDGLLEKLESWVFVEWSKANDFVQDVNYPSNMLYAAALESVSNIYNIPGLKTKAESIRKEISRQSYNGGFFTDNAMRNNSELEVTNNRTEICQYFAFYFNIADPQNYKNLWDILLNKFGPRRIETKEFPEIHPANAFIGTVMRLELLSRYGFCQQILDESVDYYLYMADRTGTLWENIDTHASCNHGFASHIDHVLYRDVLGIYNINVINKHIQLRFSDINLKWCEGIIPLKEGKVELKWNIKENTIYYTVNVPAGYTVDIENISSSKLARIP
ncbi:hypothetical protein ACFL40_06110 [candidate division KSB1 bacterium]